MNVEHFFSPADRAAIEAAVREVERGTAGEIVTYAVGRSDQYVSASWKAAVIAAVLFGGLAAVGYEAGHFRGALLWLWIGLPPALGAGLGFLLAHLVPALRRWLTPTELMELRVRQRAVAAFVDQEVFKTRERTGILIFLSLFEHRVLVLGDTAVNEQVRPEEWEEIVAGMVAGIRAGQPGAALADGVRKCAQLLTRVVPHPQDTDELSNRLRISEE
jgi:putative membrane protein